jgi:serine phosphatase RsbU (regulator of sigma subunit)
MRNISLSNAKILVIDDSKLNRTVIRKTLSELNFSVDEAEDGESGLERSLSEKFDIIFVDTVMPKMDGIDFIKEIKSKKRNDFIPLVLMTGNDDLNAKIKGLNIGADDFLQKPINQKELVARTMSLLRLKRTHDLLFERNLLIKKELEAAKKIQQFIIPHDFSHIPYPKISGKYLPMEDIGGDFFDVYKINEDKTAFVIADVTGHGIPAALIVTMAKMIFSVYSSVTESPKELLSSVNKDVYKFMFDGQYFSAFYALYDNKKKILKFSNAGHTLPLLYRSSSGKILSLDTNSGFFVGIMEESYYEEKAVKIEKGDCLILYTDGLTEMKNSPCKIYNQK